jgi:hypothetical protein
VLSLHLQHSSPLVKALEESSKSCTITENELAFSLRQVLLKLATVLKLIQKVNINALSFLLAVLELPLVLVLLGGEVALPAQLILAEFANVIFGRVPIVNAVPCFHSIVELSFIEGNGAIYLSGFSLGHVIHPMPFIKQLSCRQFAITVRLILFNRTAIESRLILDK